MRTYLATLALLLALPFLLACPRGDRRAQGIGGKCIRATTVKVTKGEVNKGTLHYQLLRLLVLVVYAYAGY